MPILFSTLSAQMHSLHKLIDCVRLPVVISVCMVLLALSLSGCMPLFFGTMAGGSFVYLMQERSAGTVVDDFTMWAAVRNRLLQYGGGDFVDVNVDVVEGRIMLTGMVKTPKLRLIAARAAWEQDGVREVINEIQLYGHEKYAMVYARDVSMNAQIKAKLLMTKNIRSANYSVETVNGTVYLFGTAYDRDELENATDLISRIKGVKRVVAHVRLRKDLKRTLSVAKSGDGSSSDVAIDDDDADDLWNW